MSTKSDDVLRNNATGPVSLEHWLWTNIVGDHGRKLLLSLGGLIFLAALFLAAGIGTRWRRIARAEAALQAANAYYLKLHQVRDSMQNGPQSQSAQAWLESVGNLAAAGISVVRIDQGNLSDRQLSFVKDLREVQRLRLQSDRATDETLALISQLPNLRSLTIDGEHFSIEGLLKLRDAPELDRIQFDCARYTPIEIAVLKAELAGVHFLELDSVPPLAALAIAS